VKRITVDGALGSQPAANLGLALGGFHGGKKKDRETNRSPIEGYLMLGNLTSSMTCENSKRSHNFPE
jgi:hypothetical protein